MPRIYLKTIIKQSQIGYGNNEGLRRNRCSLESQTNYLYDFNFLISC